MSTNNSPLAHHFSDLEQQRGAAVLGMWIFLATELLVFGAIFTGYTVYRTQFPAEFAAASDRLNLWYGGINTCVLLSSSFTMVLAVYGAQTGRRNLVVWCLALTALLGTAFLVIKGFEYYGDYVERLIPGLAFQDKDWTQGEHPLIAKHVKMFLMFYYIMTGLHALHLIIGIVIMAILTIMAWRGRFTPHYHDPLEVGGLYWHFVDVIWLFLLPLLYMIGHRLPGITGH